jgi:hypothetical protein
MGNSLAGLRLVACLFVLPTGLLLANGGAWQTGVPLSGNAAPSDKNRSTEVAIEEENLTIDLHQEFAAVEVRYRMRNTGGKVVQDFFFPVERWAASEDDMGEGSGKPADLEGYKITADNAALKVSTVGPPAARKPQPSPEPQNTESPADSAEPAAQDNEEEESREQPAPDYTTAMVGFPPAVKSWKKSEIPFPPGGTREVVIRYTVRYSGYERGVSEDFAASDKLLAYALSPAATWKGPIGRGTIVVNVLHPRPEEVAIEKPKDRFQKVSDTRFEWSFTDLEPTLDDDIKIVAHRRYSSYPAFKPQTESDYDSPVLLGEYHIAGDRYYFVHADFDVSASSTLKPARGKTYEIKNVKSFDAETPWAEGAEGDGIGESITIESHRPLPLDAIMIMPGYRSFEKPALWSKNNRVAEMEVTLNGAKTFTARIPDQQFREAYPLVVRDYDEPVKSVKLVIKGVHRGTAARDTCISSIRLKAKLAEKPRFSPAR